MCGIVGSFGQADSDTIQTMLNALAHRGPDGEQLHVDGDGRFALGHCRLAIMDPAHGQQPLYSEDGAAALVANGEIYNFRALRSELSARHKFSTYTDSEVILHGWEERGPEVVRTLDGMYAFAIGDGTSFTLARDPIGIKPLYYATESAADAASNGGPFYFASELKSLAAHFDDVREFPPGTFYDSRRGFVPYYSVPDVPAPDVPDAATIDALMAELRSTLEAAIVKRLMSDVPLGAFLSGGLDSSLIAAVTAQHIENLHTFSVGLAGSRDIEAARLVSRHIGSVHHEYLYTADDILAALPQVIYHLESFDQDLVRSAIPTFFCARLAAQHVKVILTGEGADELFAGYTYHKEFTNDARLHAELRRSITALHNMNLQRVDRLTMAHGLEGRVPFLDTSMIALAQTIPPALKLWRDLGDAPVEKWILRKACEDLLPKQIVWRSKEQFDEGSGTVDALDEVIARATADLDVEAYRAQYPDDRLKSAEECFYHKLLVEQLDRPQPVLDNVARWTFGRVADS